jgi:hypothetical protein
MRNTAKTKGIQTRFTYLVASFDLLQKSSGEFPPELLAQPVVAVEVVLVLLEGGRPPPDRTAKAPTELPSAA